jgi:dTDP-4-dehydrorhamnose reductase
MNILVLGGSGMLGAMVVDYLARDPSVSVTATVRDQVLMGRCKERLRRVVWEQLDVSGPDEAWLRVMEGKGWVVNAIGVIKPFVHDEVPAEVERAIVVNALFPHRLARVAARVGAHVLQIATDCVYSGHTGNYRESSAHDPLDVYGKSKSLGEVRSPCVHHLRCSIVGPESKHGASLLEWFLRQPSGASVRGYTNHHWNGITTLQFARTCHGIIRGSLKLPHLQHLVPFDRVAKSELLRSFAQAFGRPDICIEASEAREAVDRTLETENPELNQQLWTAAGYGPPPTIQQMVIELAEFDFRFARCRTL